MKSDKGNDVPNQFIITDSHRKIFQSYETIICRFYKFEFNKDYLALYNDMWDYSNTTRKYFKKFINEETPFHYENKAQWLKEIETNDSIEVL